VVIGSLPVMMRRGLMVPSCGMMNLCSGFAPFATDLLVKCAIVCRGGRFAARSASSFMLLSRTALVRHGYSSLVCWMSTVFHATTIE
jgi:hypothetical protein